MNRGRVVMFGSSGRIGRALAAALAKMGRPVDAMSWLDCQRKSGRELKEILSQLASLEGDVDIVFASGLTDPSASSADLALANEDPLPVRPSNFIVGIEEMPVAFTPRRPR